MKALVIETYSHLDTLQTIKRLLSDLKFDVDEIRNFRSLIKSDVNPYDLVYINTIYGRQTVLYRFIISKFKNTKLVVGVHNSHVMFFDKLDRSEKDLIVNYYSNHYREFFGVSFPKIFVKTYIRFLNFLMKSIRDRIDGVVVFGDYVECFKNPCVKIPTRITVEERLIHRPEKIVDLSTPTFTIPGGVSDAMRLYSEFLENLRRRKMKIRLKLLGKMMSRKIRNLIESDEYLKETVIFYESFIPDDVFINELMTSHFAILIPRYIPPYGKYVATGGFHDAVSTGVPLMIPENFSENINGPLIRYKDMSHLMDLIEEAAESVRKGKYVEKYLKPFLEYSRKFIPERIKKRFERFLEEIGVN